MSDTKAQQNLLLFQNQEDNMETNQSYEIDYLITEGKNLYLTLNEFGGVFDFENSEEYLQFSLDLKEFQKKWEKAIKALPKEELYVGYTAKANDAFSYFNDLEAEIKKSVQTPKYFWIKKKFESL